MPRIFYFRDPISRPTFATHIRDPHFATHVLRLVFATHLRNSPSRPTFATPFSRLTFVTPLATHISDSRSRLHSRLTFATPDRAHNRDSLFLSRLPSCDSTTDGRTVLTPQRHLPSVPTQTLILKKIWILLPGLASTTSYYPPSCPPPPVALCPLTHLLAQLHLQRPLHLLPGPLPTSPHLSHPQNLPLFPLYGNMSLMFNETSHYYCRGAKHEILGHLPLPYLSRGLLNVGIGHTPI